MAKASTQLKKPYVTELIAIALLIVFGIIFITADYMAEFFLNRALGLDQDKPHDDMTAIVMKVDVETQFNNRRILMTCPVPKYQSIFD